MQEINLIFNYKTILSSKGFGFRWLSIFDFCGFRILTSVFLLSTIFERFKTHTFSSSDFGFRTGKTFPLLLPIYICWFRLSIANENVRTQVIRKASSSLFTYILSLSIYNKPPFFTSVFLLSTIFERLKTQ